MVVDASTREPLALQGDRRARSRWVDGIAAGFKRSGIGREGRWPSIEAFTEVKTIDIDPDA
jgi:hypothetical protein